MVPPENRSFTSYIVLEAVQKSLETVKDSDDCRKDKEIFGLFEDGNLAAPMWSATGVYAAGYRSPRNLFSAGMSVGLPPPGRHREWSRPG
jgi:hypothetical protein